MKARRGRGSGKKKRMWKRREGEAKLRGGGRVGIRKRTDGEVGE